MEVKSNKATPFALSDSAKKKILSLQSNEDKRLFRVLPGTNLLNITGFEINLLCLGGSVTFS